MQKITRIYVGNYGIDMAWYDGIVFDMTDPDTGEPTDTIINLENGGGKTTLLSFIFSCFETSQERFLKHMQNKNHRFSQYFAPDGLPGVVLIEWEMPPRIAGGAPYPFVIGQVVAVKTNTELNEVDRVFFSFEANKGLTFESVPVPKLTMAPATSMSEFSRWMHEAQKASPDFFHTRTQQDWQEHLRVQMIDVEMLKLQVNFSAQEGGIDAGFLTFHSEPEFVRKFFDLTLDPDLSASVRKTVVETCDKLRLKPAFQRRLAELSTLQGSLTQFDALAQAYAQSKASQHDTRTQGSGLVLSLERRAREQFTTAEAENQRRIAQEKRVSDNGLAETAAGNEQLVLTSLRHTRQVGAAETCKTAATEKHTVATNKLRHISAAKARCEINAAEATKNELEGQAAQADAQLQPWREIVDRQGAILRRTLFTEEATLRKEGEAEREKEHAAKAARASLGKELTQLDGKRQAYIEEHATLSAAETAFELARTQLVSDELLELDESTASAVGRWTATATVQRGLETQRLQEAETLRNQGQEWRVTAKREGEEAARQAKSVEQLQAFIAEGQSERETLSQLPITRQAAEAETADPDSPALLIALDHLIQGSEREVSLSDVQLAELHASKSAIEETGVAGSSRDVNDVVACLREHGVKSATPYNTYIAKALPDAAQARKLVASNPARFMGVQVAAGEFHKARALEVNPPKISGPVMVSIAALDAEDMVGDRLVVSASDDARFNLDAAKALLATLETRVTVESERRKIFADRQRDAVTGKQRVLDYLQRYGSGKMQKAEADAIRQTAEIDAAKARELAAEAQATDCRNAETLRRAESQKCKEAAGDAERHVRELQRFADLHEVKRASRVERMGVIASELQILVDQLDRIRLEQEKHEQAGNTALQARLTVVSQADGLEKERGNLKYYDKAFQAAEYLAGNPQPLTELRDSYDSAVKTFEIEEKDRLGLLHQQLETARDRVRDRKKAFTKEFSNVQGPDILPYLKADFDSIIPATQMEIGLCDLASREADKVFAVATSMSKEFHKANKLAYAPTPEMEALDADALDTRIELAGFAKQRATAEIEAARGAAARAKELTRQAEASAKEARDVATTLRTALDLLELLDAEPILLSGDINAQTNAVIAEFQLRAKTVDSARKKAHKAFDDLRTSAMGKGLQEVEPDIAVQLQQNEFDAACADSQRLLEGIIDRIGTTQSSLDAMKADFENTVGELSNLVNTAITLLNSAVNNKKVPVGAPYVGGKSIIKMRARFNEISHDARKQTLHNYLDALIDTNIVPARGPELVANALMYIHGKQLGIQILKMVPDEGLQYVAVDKIQNSGGEGVVMAMFLYLLINQMRSETQAKLKKNGGGPLILDNPFAKATTPTLWKAQRALAQAMDVQLIFATALPDYNTVGEFSRFVRLRKAGKNTKTGRWHLEVADLKLREQEVAAT